MIFKHVIGKTYIFLGLKKDKCKKKIQKYSNIYPYILHADAGV